MPLETATYIDDLDPSNPAATDQVKQGDDHIRLVKSVLQSTFPNIDAAVTATPDELNLLAGATSLASVPTGIITLWYGASVDVPTGWGICNGSVYPKVDGSGNITAPDLRDVVVMGVGTLQATVGGAYGASTASATSGSGGAHTHALSGDGAHTHNPTIQGHALAISEMPAHTHTVGFSDTGSSGACIENAVGTATATVTTSSTGGGAAHSHDITFPGTDGTHTHSMASDGAHTHGVTVATYQPAVALHYIMKL
jgi:microcystin-dependent protein